MEFREQLITLDISDLISCTEAAGKKEELMTHLGKNNFQNILSNIPGQSTVRAMRNFHNWIKLQLITFSSKFIRENLHKTKISLLDIAVGRGGDLHKWNISNVNYVLGLDSDAKSIKSKDEDDPGAIKRRDEFSNLRTKVDFEVADVTKPGTRRLITEKMAKKHIDKFDIVSCQFALHYFFENEKNLSTVLQTVSQFLTPGGLFIGTFIDGVSILQLFKNNKKFITKKDGKEILDFQLMAIAKNFNVIPKSTNTSSFTPTFGNRYEFTIKDTKDKTLYFNSKEASIEYLTDFKKLKQLAALYGLQPLIINPFTGQITDTNFYTFEEIYSSWTPKNGVYMSEEEQAISFLNTAFIFRKTN